MTVYTGKAFQTCALRICGVWVSMRDFHAATVRYNWELPPLSPQVRAEILRSGQHSSPWPVRCLRFLRLNEETQSEGVARGIQARNAIKRGKSAIQLHLAGRKTNSCSRRMAI